MKKMKFVCFGEIMGRINPLGYQRFVQADTYEISYGGGEANVAVSLANYGKDASFVTKVPDNDISKSALRGLKAHDVDVSDVVFGGDRLGLYFVEKGASQRPSKVIYDRKYSSISMAEKGDFDWKKILDGACWFHFTGITPALSDNAAEICLDALKTAKEMGVKVSCDLNFRKNLWTSEKAGKVMGELMPYVDVAIANEEDCEKVFGIKAENTDITGGSLSHEGYKQVAKTLSEKFDIPTVAITLRGSISANDNNWAAMLYKDGEYYFSKNYLIHIVDRVGGGDSFGGGLIYALTEGYSNQDVIEFAVAASALKHTIEHDFNEVTVAEVKTLMSGDGSGRVQR
ncbi:MAG: sugar kinase [Ruminococcaceae bacterium]|nr:sugar kinase [Oscillospiraceae bacterium]